MAYRFAALRVSVAAVTPPLCIRQVVLPQGNWFVDGNIFMKSGVFLDGRCAKH